MTDGASCDLRDRSAPYGVLAVYAVAMGFLEAAVVVYLRELYHPDGFHFPLLPIPPRTAFIEIGREVATVVMIWGVTHLAGRTARDRFAAFAFVFGVWDVFYYLWLKVLIGWPAGLLDPDILFLIPLPWVGPVLAPVLVSVVLILLAFNLRPPGVCAGPPAVVDRWDWTLGLAGSALVLWTFVEPNLKTASLGNPVVYPESYDWTLFATGLGLGAATTVRLAVKRRRAEAKERVR